MLKNTRFWILLSLVAFGLPALAAACGDLDESECAPGETNDDGVACVCTDDTGASCDPDAESDDEEEESSCICEFPEGGTTGGTTTGGGTTSGPDPYRFVLVEDLTQGASGTSPGADIDSIVIAKADGTIMPASTVEDFGGIGAGDFTDPNQALGISDSNCEVQNFVALGGADAGGYIVVGFAGAGVDGTFAGGDSVVVSEIGSTMCPSDTYDDDPYSVSVSVSKDLSTFVEIATNVLGNNPIAVPAQ